MFILSLLIIGFKVVVVLGWKKFHWNREIYDGVYLHIKGIHNNKLKPPGQV